MEPKDLLLPLVAALWACGTLIFTVARELNAIRDKVLCGRDSTGRLTRKHLEVLTAHDWKPLSFAIVFLAWTFSAVAAVAPLLICRDERSICVWVIAILVSAYGAFMGVAWLLGALADLKVMRRAIEEHVDPCPSAAVGENA